RRRSLLFPYTTLFRSDEIEACLHPSAQVNMINYLYKWAKDKGVQVVLTTHSLHIIQNIYLNKDKELDENDIVINFISYSQAGSRSEEHTSELQSRFDL